MFLNLLNPTQQQLFIELARAVAEQDGIVAETEQVLLDAVQAECCVAELPAVRDLDAVLADAPTAFDNEATRSVLVLELAGIALIDGDAHPTELSVVASVAEKVGMTEEKLEECFGFAERSRQLFLDGQMLLATADGAS